MAHPLRDLAYGLVITRRVDRAMADPRAALALCDRWTTDRVSTTFGVVTSKEGLTRNPPTAAGGWP